MSALGAEVVLVDQLSESVPGQVSGGDLALVEQRTPKIVVERNAFRADQFQLKGNFRAHYLNTGPEIIRQSFLFIDFLTKLLLPTTAWNMHKVDRLYALKLAKTIQHK